MRRFILIAFVICGTALGKVDLVTLPSRDAVQLTIYNSADMTLVREGRSLTMQEGANRLQFSWANTLIDPTSLQMLPKAHAGEIDIANLTYPPRVRNLGLWNVVSEVEGQVPVEISYLTSGLSWRAFYMGTLSADEKTMRLQGYVRVSNNSGEDYENAQVRLIVGKVHILDQIRQLAQRQHPYGRPGVGPVSGPRPVEESAESVMRGVDSRHRARSSLARAKKIVKEGLSEYFLYTIEGKETVANGWSKRLKSFDVAAVPVVNLYKYEQERYGGKVVRFLNFKNDTEHKLGQTPIPGGVLKVYKDAGHAGHLAYTGQSSFKYIPVDEDVELNIGAVSDVVVEPTLMNFATQNYRFDSHGNIVGWDELKKFEVEVKNTRPVSVKVEIQRNYGTQYWDLVSDGDLGEFEKIDLDTVKYTVELEPRSAKKFGYTVRTYHGVRQSDWRK